MAQFTKYSSADAGAPELSGTAGSLINVLTAVLVTGYGSKTAAGWTNPVATAGNCASYKQGGGAGYAFQINDNGPHVTPSYSEAWATGWKVCTAVTAPVGTGSGQFPTAAQLLTTGHVVIRKSLTTDAVPRPWVIFADDRTLYLMVRGAHVALDQLGEFMFGEIYSYYATDDHSCIICGRTVENNTNGPLRGGINLMRTPATTSPTPAAGCYAADNQAGSSGSLQLWPCGDTSLNATARSTSIGAPADGNVPAPNMANSALYVAPYLLLESTWAIRGRFRGLVHLCHPVSSVADGTIITGANIFAGKTFQVFNPGSNNGHNVIETSDTLDTR